ncbi:MAG: hypothetical protein QOF76_4540 [Solirubrobacteraceae bacterium]|nr:hypothetical protein [Solirubrobacteraceae bacterium]
MRADPRVDDYINGLPGWQQAICREVRELLHAADPEVDETIKRSVQPYFTLRGNVAALLAAKAHVTVFLYDPLIDVPDGLVVLGTENASGRYVQIREGDAVPAAALQAIFAQIVAHNRAGGWRKLQKG